MQRALSHIDSSEPVFVTGPSRSGTTLVQAILNESDELWVVRETHYFDDLRPKLDGNGAALLSEANASRCERYFLALAHRPYGQGGIPDRANVDRDELRTQARELGWTGDAFFEAYCRIRTEEHDRLRWGEKTPRHVFRIDEILAFRPTAKIVCLVRDPRAVAASYRDWKRTMEAAPGDRGASSDNRRAALSYNVVLNALLWRSAAYATLQASQRYGPDRVHVLRYEGLVETPEQTVRELADWLGLRFNEAMLKVPVVHSSYRTHGSGISREPLERWRGKLTETEVSIIQRHCGQLMNAFGYACDS